MLNILLTINESYIKPVKVLMYSVWSNNPSEITFWILYRDISGSGRQELQDFVSRNSDCAIHFIRIDEECIDDLPLEGSWSREIYFRLFAPYILTDLDSVIYLDGDTLVTGDITELSDICEKNNMTFAAVPNDVEDRHKNRLGLLSEDHYYNSGVLVMNLKKFRNCMDREELISNLLGLKNRLLFPDQDFINYIFRGRIYTLGRQYNYMISVTERDQTYSRIQNPRICHYVLAKPWNDYFVYRTDIKYFSYMLHTEGIKEITRLLIKHRFYRMRERLKKQ